MTQATADVRRAAAITAASAQWAELDQAQRRERMTACAKGLYDYFADQVDPDRVLDDAERDRRITLKRKQLAATASAKGVEVRRANAAQRRRSRVEAELADLVEQVATLLVAANAA